MILRRIAANVAEARRGRPVDLSVLFLAGEDELDGLEAAGIDEDDEIVLRPWSVDALRWRIEAMAIRAQVPTSAVSDAVLSGGHVDVPTGGRRRPCTRCSTRRAASARRRSRRISPPCCRSRKQMQVLLLDADTVTGHVGLSLGLSGGRSAADSWVDEDAGYPHETLLDIAETHSSGIRVVALSTNPLSHPTLKAERVSDAISEARHASTRSSSTSTRPTARSTSRSSRSPTGSSSP